jgi:hypothetical protein
MVQNHVKVLYAAITALAACVVFLFFKIDVMHEKQELFYATMAMDNKKTIDRNTAVLEQIEKKINVSQSK